VSNGRRALGSGYLLEEVIGRGATGQVWRGSTRTEGMPVAIKVLRPELGDDPEIVARFLRERTVMTSLIHPNLIRVHDLVAEQGSLAIVMDLVQGSDLRRLLTERHTLDPELVCRVGTQVATGLAAAHTAGVVHRDLKPENVLVDPSSGSGPVARVTDFGTAALGYSPSLTRHSRIVGTPEYMAPEQASGGPATGAVDVYALGVMLYELLSGRPPFTGDHPMAVLRGHLDTEPTRLAGVPDHLWAVVAACLDKDPAMRPQAEALREQLAALAPRLAGVPALQVQGNLITPPTGEDERPTRIRLRKPAAADNAGGPERKPVWRRPKVLALGVPIAAAVMATILALVLLVGLGPGEEATGALRQALATRGREVARTSSTQPPIDKTSTTQGTEPPIVPPSPGSGSDITGSTVTRTTLPKSTKPTTSIRTPPSSSLRTRDPPQDVYMYRVWRQREAGEAHAHGLGTQQWAAQRFIPTKPWIRAVEVNVGGHTGVTAVGIRLMLLEGSSWVDVRTDPTVPIVQNGVTRRVYDRPVRVESGRVYLLQVVAGHGPIAVYFSNSDEDPRIHSYLWRPPGSDPEACRHGPEEMNMGVIGWSRAS